MKTNGARGGVHRARTLRDQGAVAVLRRVHEAPGITRADLARDLDLSSSSTTEITARLKERGLVAEVDAASSGARGRPSPSLVPHPAGPLVAVAEVTHSGWRVAAVELGAHIVATRQGDHRSRAPEAVIAELRASLSAVARSSGRRFRAVGISVAAAVVDGKVAQAPTMRWADVDLTAAVPPGLAGRPVIVANDATLAGLGEARRGAAATSSVALYLDVEAGIGGTLVIDGRPAVGATGAGGEFGHLPFGDPARRCPCGATGCWGLEVDGGAMARLLGRANPSDPRRVAAEVIDAARAGSGRERDAVRVVAAALGRGSGGLVNALDPDVVVLGGYARGVFETSPTELRRAYKAALMRHRRANPPPVVGSSLGSDGALVGAAESAFDLVLTPDGLAAWDGDVLT